jgi:hypothetical protein
MPEQDKLVEQLMQNLARILFNDTKTGKIIWKKSSDRYVATDKCDIYYSEDKYIATDECDIYDFSLSKENLEIRLNARDKIKDFLFLLRGSIVEELYNLVTDSKHE